MESPFTGGKTRIEKEHRSLEFRKDKFDIIYHFYVCEDTGEQFTTTELDTLNINQVHNKYREKYGIPFVDEIKKIREKYGLSAVKMSAVLGLGTNVYRNYEAGEMPSVSTGRLIRLAQDPNEFLSLLEMSKNALDEQEYEKVKGKIRTAKSGVGERENLIFDLVFSNKYPNIFNGYRVPDIKRIGYMVRFFAQQNKPFTTALNKFIFYSDFGHFKMYGTSISGISYKAIDRGPVPENYDILYNQIMGKGYAKVKEVDFKDFVGEKYFSDAKPVLEEEELPLSDSELAIMKEVAEKFKNKNTRQIVDMSHEELAWQSNVSDYNTISYEFAFDLKNLF